MGNKVLAMLTRGLEFDSQSPHETMPMFSGLGLAGRLVQTQQGTRNPVSQSEREAWLRKTPNIDFWLPHSRVCVHHPQPLSPMITITTITITTLLEGNREQKPFQATEFIFVTASPSAWHRETFQN